MSAEVHIDGNTYISAAVAAKEFSYTRDYVARLCREGKVAGRKVGGAWYASSLSLRSFAESQSQARELRRRMISGERARNYHRTAAISRMPIDEITWTDKNGVNRAGEPIMSHVRTMQTAIKELAVPHADTISRAAHYAATPYTAAETIVRAAHLPAQHLSPLMDVIHKVTALAFVCLVTVGVYAAMRPDHVRIAADRFSDTSFSLIGSVSPLRGENQRAAAGEISLWAVAFGPARSFVQYLNNVFDELFFELNR